MMLEPTRHYRGRPPSVGGYERTAPIGPAGVVVTACLHRGQRNTGSPSGGGVGPPTGCPRGTGRAVWGDGEARSTDEAG